jgi:hypothetical protein
MDYETICQYFGWVEWPNLKERIHEPDVQTSIQSFKDAFERYQALLKTTGEKEASYDYAEWCLLRADRQLCNLVNREKVFHPIEPYPEWLPKKKYQQKIDAIIPLDKVLPDDILDIIRQFSKPAFIHFREYNQALALFHLTPRYKQKLKKKIVVPLVREQLKICVDAQDDYHKIKAVYLHHKTPLNEELSYKSRYWADVSRDKFVALLDETEYYQQGYAAWYFQDDIDDAWMDISYNEMTEEEDRLAALCQDEEMDRCYIRMEKRETLMMEGEDRRGINECYDGLDGLYTVLSV